VFEIIVIFGIGAFVEVLLLWLLGVWYWARDKHRADRATYEVTARCACHPHLEGRGRRKIKALRKLEAAVTQSGSIKQGAQ
jgi:hypothetical protein